MTTKEFFGIEDQYSASLGSPSSNVTGILLNISSHFTGASESAAG